MIKHLLACTLLLACCFASAQEIFDMPNATGTYLTGINDSGEICGYYTVTSGNTIAFWINKYGDTIILHGPNGNDTYVNATGINNKDQVVGNYGSSSNVAAAQSFIYLPNAGRNSGGNYALVSNWGGTNTQAAGITDDTCISGSYQVGGNDCGASWCKGNSTPTSLRCSNGGTVYPTYGCDINTVNHNVCGFIIQGGMIQSFIYRSSIDAWDTFQVLGALKSKALGMNDNGWICGNYSNATRGFYAKKIWQQNLSNVTSIKIAGATTIYPSHINNSNGIVGFYTDAAGVDHGFILATYDIGFRPSVNGYNFANSNADVWAPAYYNEWDYVTDPYLNDGTSFALYNNVDYYISQYAYPAWQYYVMAFPATHFYRTVGPVKIRNRITLNKWRAQRGSFGGACYGFAVSSGLVFDNAALLDASYPTYTPYHGLNLFNYPKNDTTRTLIHKIFAKQYSKELGRIKKARLDSTMAYNIQLIQQDLRNSRGRYHSGMSIRDQHASGGHALFPYKLVPGLNGDGVDTVYVYDCNHPGQDNLFMTVDLKAGHGGDWHYDAHGQDADYGGSPNGKGFALYGPDTMVLSRQLHIGSSPIIDGPGYARSGAPTPVTAMFNDSSIVQMTDDSSNVAVFSIDTTAGTALIDPMDNPGGLGKQQVKETYNQGSITQVTKVNHGTLQENFLLISDDNYLIRCDRPAGSDTTDNYSLSAGSLTYQVVGNTAHTVGFTVDVEDSINEYNYYITQLNVPGTQQVTVSLYGSNNGIVLQNFGPPTTYVITTEFITDSLHTFRDSIAIQGNTQHIIQPHDTTASGIYILVDTGMTGHIEDSIFIHQTITDINRISAPNITAWPVPSADQLFMSGPQGLISYTIVDILGRPVANGKLDFGAGNTRQFDISNLIPGVYVIQGAGTTGKWNYTFVKQ